MLHQFESLQSIIRWETFPMHLLLNYFFHLNTDTSIPIEMGLNYINYKHKNFQYLQKRVSIFTNSYKNVFRFSCRNHSCFWMEKRFYNDTETFSFFLYFIKTFVSVGCIQYTIYNTYITIRCKSSQILRSFKISCYPF